MVKTESCVLCFANKSKWFLDIFCEENQSMNISPIISKHLWFDLKPSDQCYVCAECWKNVYDFHLFYCKLEKIHLDNNESNPKSTQPDFEFHPVDEVKIEPLDDYETEKSVITTTDPTSAGVGNDSSEADELLKRRSPTASTQKPVISESESGEDDNDFLAEDGPDYIDDDDDDDDDDNETDVKYATVKQTETPKTSKRRGRPPKNAASKKDSETEIDASEYGQCSKDGERKHKSKRRKRFKKESSDESSESDSGSNYGDRRKSCGKRTRDERLFSYISEFICYICPERVEFERFHHANLHYREVHQEPAYLKCTKCDRKCFSPGGFINHMETHDDPEKNKCPICGKVTDQRITLKKHMRAHRIQMEETLPFACSQCPRRFDLEKARDKHERLHGRKFVVKREKGRDEELIAFYKKISCDICDEEKNDHITYDNFWDLKNHMNSEHNKTPYLKCPVCFKKNVCRQQLIVHIEVHENPDKYRCDICGEVYQFLEKHKFKVHGREAETDDKSYSCEHCGKMFRCETNLKNHIDRVHGVKDVMCGICNKSFSKKAISAHKRSAHSDEMFMCEQCPKMFKTRSGLESHKSEHDVELRKPVKCELCGKEMRRGASLTKHMKVIHSQEDPVNCNMCGKQFRTKFHMTRHRTNTCSATIDSRPFKCEVCGKGFSMRLTMTEHMTTHTRTSLYQCAFCFKTFGYISNLYKHRKKAHPEEWQEVQARPEQGIATVIEMRN
ncbi:zinc finger protein 708-like [Toxorhynchites rutilus septentrionalis]|uniref:zinc finger protein 708-like n=1 Tax=Toxorhynchites rutilus septentrionalis TaxID=329112 RepID=UPI00247AE95B|nr:zinc finger protein 708-like [Toxorhynchites rutilus septentrionalis]